MQAEFKKLVDDIQMTQLAQLPVDDKSFNKIKCRCEHGNRVYWYGIDDLQFAKDEGEDIHDNCPYSGIIMAAPYGNPRGELDIEQCIVVMDDYPVEKHDIEVCYIALGRLINDEDLVEIFDKSEDKNERNKNISGCTSR